VAREPQAWFLRLNNGVPVSAQSIHRRILQPATRSLSLSRALQADPDLLERHAPLMDPDQPPQGARRLLVAVMVRSGGCEASIGSSSWSIRSSTSARRRWRW
jgi:hypothetical protein